MRMRKSLLVFVLLLAAIAAWAIDVWFAPENTTIQVAGSNVIYSTSFMTKIASTYQIQVQQSGSIESTNWTSLDTIISATGGTVTWSYTNWGAATQPQQFYRLRVRIVP